MPNHEHRLHQVTGRWQIGFCLSFICAFLWGILPIALKYLLRDMDGYTIFKCQECQEQCSLENPCYLLIGAGDTLDKEMLTRCVVERTLEAEWKECEKL